MSKLTDAVKNVYIYAYPLVLTELIHWGSDDKKFEHLREFPDQNNRRVTQLNNDTLYSYAWTQLVHSPYLIHIPEIAERYYLFPIMDAYSNVIYSIGTRTPEMSKGDYILLYKDESVPSGYEDYKVLRSNTSLNSILLRIETRGKEDYNLVNKIQDSITIEPLYPEKIEAVPKGDGIVPVEYIEELSGKEYFELFAKLVKDNGIYDDKISKEFALIGYDFQNQVWNYEGLDDDAKEAIEQGAVQGYEVVKKWEGKHSDILVQRGWNTIYGHIGVFGNDYEERAGVNRSGWGGNILSDTLYSSARRDDENQEFDSDKDYILHFQADEFPPAAIFWSVTLYGLPSRFPVENEINRFAINSFALKNGDVELNADGSLDIYISNKAPKDKKQYKNWLPSPKDEKSFTLAIRNYWPLKQGLDRKWNPPSVREV